MGIKGCEHDLSLLFFCWEISNYHTTAIERKKSQAIPERRVIGSLADFKSGIGHFLTATLTPGIINTHLPLFLVPAGASFKFSLPICIVDGPLWFPFAQIMV